MTTKQGTRVWLHSRKGRIVGEIVRQDGPWTHIRLAEDAWADVRRRNRAPAGSIETYRTEFLVEMADTDEGNEQSNG